MTVSVYSSFEHMVNTWPPALFLRPDALMAIIKPDPLTLYCDASGKEGDPLIVNLIGGTMVAV